MANRYQLINEMTSETLKEITQNGESWIKFLNTASNNYKYSFNEQVLIYAQKPNATACADIETWNKKLRRWVNKGAKGIALLSMENGRNVLRHVFDISDTHSGINKDFKLWEIKPSYENGIIETLENSFGNLEVKSNLAEAIYSASINLVEDNYQDYLVDLKEVLDGSLLEGMQDIDLEGNFIVLLAKSISYMAMKRCGIDPTEHFNVSDFEMISSFNNKRVVSRLGAAISDIAEQELREIYSSVINYQKNYKLTNRTFVNNEKINYHNNEEKNNEGRNDYDRINIQSNGRLPNTTSSITKNEESGTGEILKNEGEIPKRTQKRVIRGINVRWQDGRTFRRNRANSPKENETDNNKSSREESNNRGNEKRESNELGTSNELNKEPSRRNDNVRANLQLNLFEDTYVPPIKELPSVDTQINSIQAQAEVENTPAFSFTQEMIDKTLIEGSNFSHSKYRIYEQFKRSLSAKENIIFLKHEYGIGGSSSAYSGADFGQEHDSKGIKLYKGYKDDRVELLINWSNVEQRLKEIIRLDRYFNDEEKIKYQEWLENDYEKEKWMLDRGLKENTNDFIDISSINIEKNYKLSNGNYFHFHTNDEGYYYAIYDNRGTEIDGGLLEYSENADKKTLDDIRKDLAKFTDITELADTNLEEVSQEFIDNLEQEAELKDIADRVESQIIANAISAVKELSEDPKTTFINDLVSIKGDKPTEGYLKLNGENKIETIEMVMKSYPVECTEDECKITGDRIGNADTEAPVLELGEVTVTYNTITIPITKNEDNKSDELETKVYYGTTDALGEELTCSSDKCEITGLTQKTTYYYKVVSKDESGNSTTLPKSGLSTATTGEKEVLCKRAVKLNTTTCQSPSSSYHCAGAKFANGATITYGRLGESGTLTSGDAFDCDVDNDSKFEERFYYVTDSSAGNAVLIYNYNTKGGIKDTTSEIKYDSSYNYYGPRTARENLPTTLQWKNPKIIYPTTRKIPNG